MGRNTTDLFRLAAMMMVCAIHATALSESRFIATHDYLSADALAVMLNQLGRFCVPLFILLSGFGLTLSHAKKHGDSRSLAWLPTFARERFLRIGLPYLAWTVLFMFVLGRWHAQQPLASLTQLGRDLLHGTGDYHLYFFPIIIQCYVLFPLLLRIRGSWLWWVLLMVQILFTSPAHYLWAAVGIERPSFPSYAVIYWLFYFHTGMVLARHADAVPMWLRGRAVATVLWAFAGAAVLAEYAFWSYRQSDPGYFNHFNRWVVIAFTLATIALMNAWDARVNAWFKVGTRASTLGLLAMLSFPVYLGHTLLLRALNQTALASQPLLLALVLIVTAMTAAWILHRLVRWPWLRLPLGLS